MECRHASHYNSSVLWGNSQKIKTKLQATKNKRERSVDSGKRKTFILYCLFVSNSHSHRRRIVLRHYSILIGAKVCSAFVWSENSFNWKECNYFAFVPRTNVISNNSNNGRIVVTKMFRNKTSTGILNLLIDLTSNTMALSISSLETEYCLYAFYRVWKRITKLVVNRE